MQNSNLSKLFPRISSDWSLFLNDVSSIMEHMIDTYNIDKRRIKDLDRIINKISEINNFSKDNVESILKYKELFMYIDNSLESSFLALDFFARQNNMDNEAVKTIYERIIYSPKIMELTSEYNSLTIKVQFDKDRIKKLQGLLRGTNIDYHLIKELIDKAGYDDVVKKNIMFYPTILLSIKQKDNIDINNVKVKKENNIYNKVSSIYQDIKNFKTKNKDIIIKCFQIREKMNLQEIDKYRSYINDLNSINEFDDDKKVKIYAVAFLTLKNSIENLALGISDLAIEEIEIDDELVNFKEMLNQLSKISDSIRNIKSNRCKENKVFFALDAFNRLIINDDILSENDLLLICKKCFTSDILINNNQILQDDVYYYSTTISKYAYLKVDDNILILTGENIHYDDDRFYRLAENTIKKNALPIKKQIQLIKNNSLEYIELENQIIDYIMNKKTNKKK